MGAAPAAPGHADNGAVVAGLRARGLVWATANGQRGGLLAPLTGELVAALLATGEEPDEALSPARFERVGAER